MTESTDRRIETSAVEPPAVPSRAWPSLLNLFLAFARLGLSAFGGPSMIAYIRRVSVEQEHWLDAEAFGDGVAFCQMIPGATAMQAAAYVGLRKRGVAGAAVCFIGFGLPAFLLMTAFAALYGATHELPAVVSAFTGLQAIVVSIVANAAYNFGRTTLKNWRHILIAAAAAGLFIYGANPVLVILAAAAAGWIVLRTEPEARKGTPSPIDFSFVKPFSAILGAALAGLLVLYLFDRKLFDLSVLLLRIDLTAFGGGFASVPLMLHEVVDVRHWLDFSTFMNGIILGQATPGPIVITATFIGYLLYGLPGGVIATVSIFLPSFLLVIGGFPFFARLQSSGIFQRAVAGVLCSFVGLIVAVILRFAGNVAWDGKTILLAGAALVALLLKVDVFWVVLGGVVLSLLLFL
jgi:chromate transporter